MKNQFNEVSSVELSTVFGGSRESHCQGQIAGRIFKKTLLGQRILPTDYILD
ncbi:bacteriocin class II family protein [Streptococcus phocae subsp. salmonis]|uniref:bacteriocin class II family protein n=1 Tax=Streptococcus phocae TaxID=119224 RepID=UPI000AAB8A0D|nr:bacteriocin class II family protein [Streptococcus phocae]